jgi:hypothetical protein
MARLGLRAQAPCNRIEEPAHQCQVRVADVQLLFDAIDGFDQIVLIAAREGHAGNGRMYGGQGLVYCDLLLPIHATENLNPFRETRKPFPGAPKGPLRPLRPGGNPGSPPLGRNKKCPARDGRGSH